jgi:hypothetical protein
MRERQFWTFFGNLKLVLSQLGIYFSVFSMVGIGMTTWHTTISPIFESHGYTLSFWWFVAFMVFAIFIMIVVEWKRSTSGFIRSWALQFYSPDNPLRGDIELLLKENKEIKQEIAELKNLLPLINSNNNSDRGSISE